MESTLLRKTSTNPITPPLEQAGAFLFWTTALIIATIASVQTFVDLTAPWFKPVLVSRMLLALFAAVALLMNLSDRRLPAIFSGVFSLAALASHSFYTFSVGPSTVLMDLSGVLFLVGALVYRGSIRLWWRFFMPVSLLLLFLPVARLESSGAFDFGRILGSSLIPMMALAGGALIATMRETRGRSFAARRELDHLAARNRNLVHDLRNLEKDMKSLLSLVRGFSLSEDMAAVAKLADNTATVPGSVGADMEEVSDVRVASVSPYAGHLFPNAHLGAYVGAHFGVHLSSEESETEQLDPLDLYQVLKETVEEVRAILLPSKKVQLILAGPAEIPVPMSIHGNRESIRLVLRSVIGLSVDALGGAEGVVRVSLRLGLGQLTVVIEDNGRGFNEDMIRKMEARGTMVRDARLASSFERKSLADARQVLESVGGRMEISARLGVGSRIVLDFPRMDAFSRGVLFPNEALGLAASSSHSPRAPYREGARPSLLRPLDQDSQHA